MTLKYGGSKRIACTALLCSSLSRRSRVLTSASHTLRLFENNATDQPVTFDDSTRAFVPSPGTVPGTVSPALQVLGDFWTKIIHKNILM